MFSFPDHCYVTGIPSTQFIKNLGSVVIYKILMYLIPNWHYIDILQHLWPENLKFVKTICSVLCIVQTFASPDPFFGCSANPFRAKRVVSYKLCKKKCQRKYPFLASLILVVHVWLQNQKINIWYKIYKCIVFIWILCKKVGESNTMLSHMAQ